MPIGAYGGWVVWSVPTADNRGWTLSALHEDQIVALPAAPRSVAFDLDLGADAAGRPVATYSRCTKTVSLPGDFTSTGHRGCRVRILDLATGVERGAGIPRPAGASDTMPSMWRGRIAFARTRPRSDIDQVMLWDPARRQMRTLKHGGLPSRCADRYTAEPCGKPPDNTGQVSALDLGARLVAFRWNVSGDSITGHAASELRASTLDGRRGILLHGGYVYEACDETDSVTSVSLGRPTVDGGTVWFTTEAQRCASALVELNRVRTSPYRRAAARIPGNTLKSGITEVVRDANRIYALVGHQVTTDRDAACPCVLTSRDVPTLKRSRRGPSRAFE